MGTAGGVELVWWWVEPQDVLAEMEVANAPEEGSEEDEAYETAMSEGQDAFGRQAWDEAQAAFERASDLKPAERAPKDNLAEIRRLRKSEDAASAENERRMQRLHNIARVTRTRHAAARRGQERQHGAAPRVSPQQDARQPGGRCWSVTQ